MTMRALDLIDHHGDKLSTLGTKAREQARANGVSAYFIDQKNPDFITEERPDGTRAIIDGDEKSGKYAAE